MTNRVTGVEREVAYRWLRLKELRYVDALGSPRRWEVVERTTQVRRFFFFEMNATLLYLFEFSATPAQVQGTDGVAGVATVDGQLVVVKQYRPAVDREVLELPAGLVDVGEEPVAAAVRELREETGFHGQPQKNGVSPALPTDPGISNSTTRMVLLDAGHRGPVALEDGEHIETLLLPLSGLRDYLDHSDAMVDSRLYALAAGIDLGTTSRYQWSWLLRRWFRHGLTGLRDAASSRHAYLTGRFLVLMCISNILEEYCYSRLPNFNYFWTMAALELGLFATTAAVAHTRHGAEDVAGGGDTVSKNEDVQPSTPSGTEGGRRHGLTPKGGGDGSSGFNSDSPQKTPALPPSKNLATPTTFAEYMKLLLRRPRAPIWLYAVLGISMAMSQSLGKAANRYVNFTVSTIFKCAKAWPTMAVGFCCLGRRYGVDEMVGATSMALSALFFALGASEVDTSFEIIGVVYNVGYLVFQSTQLAFQELVLKDYGATVAENMLYANFFGFLVVFAVISVSGELIAAIAYFSDLGVAAVVLVCARTLTFYSAVHSYALIVQESGAVAAVTVGILRKILTIVVSMLLFRKPYSHSYPVGAFFLVLALAVEANAGLRKARANKKKFSSNANLRRSNNDVVVPGSWTSKILPSSLNGKVTSPPTPSTLSKHQFTNNTPSVADQRV